MQHAKRGLSSQRRGYLSLYPKPDSGTQNPPTFSQLYYKLPDYAIQRDHKQARDPKLDKTNTDELTRDEERRQRVQVMSWRREMAEKGEQEPKSEWEHKNSDGGSAFRDHWSGAQLLEYHLRKGRVPQGLPSVESEKAKIDPHGILDSDQPLDVAWSSLPHYKPNQISFRSIPQQQLQQLSSRYQRLTGSQFPSNGLDFPEIVKKLSSLNSMSAVSDADAFLADLCEATSAGYSCDEVMLQLKANTRFESKYEWFTSENNHRFQNDEMLSDEAIPRLADAFESGGPKGFWKALIEENEIDADFKSHMTFFLSLSKDELMSVIQKVEQLHAAYGEIMERRYNRLVKVGGVDPTDPIQKASLILGGVLDWAQTGDAGGEKKEDDDEWELERLELLSVLDTTVIEGKSMPLSEWLRWHFLDQFIVPNKLELFNPTHLLAARFQNQTFSSALRSLIADHISHIRTVYSFLYTSDRSELPFYQFLRCVKNCSNIPNYNLNMSSAYFNAQKSLQRYQETNSFDKEMVDGGDEDMTDLSSQIAELFIESPSRDWSNSNTASAAREQVRKDASAWGLVRQLKRKEVSFENRAVALQAAKAIIRDVENCIGVLRRKAASDIQTELAAGENAAFAIQNVALNTDNNIAEAGKRYTVSWEWTPSGDYGIQKSTVEKKEKAFSDFLSHQAETSERIVNEGSLVDDVFNYIQSIDGADDSEGGHSDTRREWAVTKTYHSHMKSKALSELNSTYFIENNHPVHVVLLKSSSDSLLSQIKSARDQLADISKSTTPEDVRLVSILNNISQFVVDSHLEEINHLIGSDEVATRLAEGVAEGTLTSMVKSFDAAADIINDSSNGSGWDAVAVLHSSVPNSGSAKVVIPNTSSSDGVYKVAVFSEDFSKVGESQSFTITNNINNYVDEYLTSQRGTKPPLNGQLLNFSEVPDVVTFLKTKGIHFTLQSESLLGSDVVTVPVGGVTGAMPFVDIDVLKYQLAHLHSLPTNCPVESFAVRNEPVLRHFWEKQNPGGSELEWIKVKAAVSNKIEQNCYEWLAYDGELEQMKVDQREDYLNSKMSNLSTSGGTSLATARYEGSGYITELDIDEEVKRMRVPITPPDVVYDVSTPLEFVDRSTGHTVRITKTDTSLVLSLQGSEEAVTTIRFNERRWSVELGEVVISLPMGQEGVRVLGELQSRCKGTSTDSDIPDEISLQLHHIATICADAINGAHTDHCTMSEVMRQRYLFDEQDAVGITKPPTEPTPEEQVQLPTKMRCWMDATSAAAELSPTGLAIQRRRFDSWQLKSGHGRYDVSPTRDTKWQHPIEENPSMYSFEDTQLPMSTF